MGAFINYKGIKPMSACGYKIVRVKDNVSDDSIKNVREVDPKDVEVVAEITFNLDTFIENNPRYRNATVVSTKQERGITTIYLRAKN